jgi:hypothetical protein
VLNRVDAIFISLAIVLSSVGVTVTILFFIRQWHTVWLRERLLHEKQLVVYEEITGLIGQVKAILEYTSGDETLGEWRSALMTPVREMLAKSYEWSVFLPDELQDLPTQYASKVARGINKLSQTNSRELDSFASIIQDIRVLENEAAQELQQRIREFVGINSRIITPRR